MKTIFAALAALTLCACASVTPEQGMQLGLDLYCVALTEAGKQAIRDHVTAGAAVLACPEAPDQSRSQANH